MQQIEELLYMDNSSIKENIVRRRTAEGISQDEMAKRLDISRNAYRSIEKGESKVISDRLKDIADNLGISLEELVLGYNPRNGSGELNEIRERYEHAEISMKEDYEKRILALNNKISMLEDTIRDLREIIELKTEVNSMLKKELSANNR